MTTVVFLWLFSVVNCFLDLPEILYAINRVVFPPLTPRACVKACICAPCICVKEGSVSFGGLLGDNKHFKASLCNTEHDICPTTRDLSTDLLLFSLRLTRRQSKMSFSLTLFWWICSTVCLLKSTTEDLANEPWALWIKQQGRREVAREKPRTVGSFEEQRGAISDVIGADSGNRDSPAQERKPRLEFSNQRLVADCEGTILSGILTRKARVAFYHVSTRTSTLCVAFCSSTTAFNCTDPVHTLDH